MKRAFLLLIATALMFGVAALALQQAGKTSHPLIDWAAKGLQGKARTALLLEFGLKDDTPRDWSGKADVKGATVGHREGYRFRDDDKLAGADAWQAKSHRGLRAPKGMPAIGKMERIATVGVVMHLEDVAKDGSVQIELTSGDKATVPLGDILAGKTVPLWNGEAVARLASTTLQITDSPGEDDFPAAAHGPNGSLWLVFNRYTLRDAERRIEPPQLLEQPKDFAKYHQPEASDCVIVQCRRPDGVWSAPKPLTGTKEDTARCAVAVDRTGVAWVAYSTQRDGNFDIYVRPVSFDGKTLSPEPEQRLTTSAASDITPVMATDAAGTPWLAFQSWGPDKNVARKATASIVVLSLAGGKWQEKARINPGGNCWNPALAAGPRGEVALAYDVYENGQYNVYAHVFTADGIRAHPIATSPAFEARPSIVYDLEGRLWVAYEEGPEKWGKDYGALVPGKGNPLYNQRSIRVVCLDVDNKLRRTTAELPTAQYTPPTLPFEPTTSNAYEKAIRYSYPKIGIDSKGRVWLGYRRNFGTRYTTHGGPYWLTFLRRLDGQTWSEPIEVFASDGMHDHRPSLLPTPSGGVEIVYAGDSRQIRPEAMQHHLFRARLDLPDAAGVVQFVDHDPGASPVTPEIQLENDAVARIRAAKVRTGGKELSYHRGEYHRHTEISWDGASDGSLEDMFRYAIDAVQFDWVGNGDHDNGAGREYTWWLTQKFSDAYHVADRFTTMFTYERSVAYPHGHRNVMFAKRGVMTLPRLKAPEGKKAEGGVHPDDAKMLYRYLHAMGGVCAGHTSATSMGTDWRDNDPLVEPIVEIYQGDRMSYEHEGAPRAGYEATSGKTPVNVAGWFPKGFINLALQKGYKLGFQASSDHWSTHISFFIILAEKGDREGLLDAVRKRHCYGATDDIIVDFRCGDAIMGDDVKTTQAPTLAVKVVGTSDLDKVEILRDSEVVATLPVKGATCDAAWTDPAPRAGVHYYYARILQKDAEIAWASPIWVELTK
jgi:hypothetical protein